MNTEFKSLARNVFNEILTRDNNYFEKVGVEWPSKIPNKWVENVNKHVTNHDQLNKLLEFGARELDELGVISSVGDKDPVAEQIFYGLVDASKSNDFLLSPVPDILRTVEEIIDNEFECDELGNGLKVYSQKSGTHPLLVINALGISLKIWNLLLSDTTHDFKIILCDTRCSSLLDEGMNSDVDIGIHCDDISSMLEKLNFSSVDILAWCNGGRIALELANKLPSMIGRIVLLSTTLRGVKGISKAKSPFEDNLEKVFSTVIDNPEFSDSMVRLMKGLIREPDWSKSTSDDLFQLPSSIHSKDLLAPMSSGENIMNYARRTIKDEKWPLDKTISDIYQNILFISGSHDNIINSKFVRDVLQLYGNNIRFAQINGAGHYIQYLQYPYLLSLLKHFLLENRLPSNGMARVSLQ